jgi:hypothetical protein
MTSRTDLYRLDQLLRGEASNGRLQERDSAQEIEALRQKARGSA